MTEAEWLACEDPRALAEACWSWAGGYKVRLLACAICRSPGLWALLDDERSTQAVVAAEANVAGASSAETLAAAEAAAAEAVRRQNQPGRYAALACKMAAARKVPLSPFLVHANLALCERHGEWRLPPAVAREWCGLMRDILRHPSRPLSAPTATRTAILNSLARAAFDERILPVGYLDNARLAVLSDALEEAGCTDVDLLSHLRSPGPHVRGCWALDLVLGKE